MHSKQVLCTGSQTACILLGFACNEAFVYSLFYTGVNNAEPILGLSIERIDLLATLVFMCLAFGLYGRASKEARDSYLSSNLLWCHALLMVLGAAVALPQSYGLSALLLEGFLVGAPFAVMLCAWGRVLGALDKSLAISLVLLSTGLAAAVCFLVGLIALVNPYAWGVLSFLPLLSTYFLVRNLPKNTSETQDASPADANQSLKSQQLITRLLATADQLAETSRLSRNMLFGTFAFGLSAGLMETFGSDPGMDAAQALPATLLFLTLLSIALLQIAGYSFAQPNKLQVRTNTNLHETYRLCILVMMAGYLFVYVLKDFGIPGESIVLAGYLGLTSVFVCLFLLLAQLSNTEVGSWFARGFLALYLGELVGLLLGNVFEQLHWLGNPPYILAAAAGLVTLFSYQFLFTEHDFVNLTSIARAQDVFGDVCTRIAEDCGLSKRESEILPLALKGRSAERIAQELYISKSTVDTHLKRIYAKCSVHGRQELLDFGEKVSKELSGEINHG